MRSPKRYPGARRRPEAHSDSGGDGGGKRRKVSAGHEQDDADDDGVGGRGGRNAENADGAVRAMTEYAMDVVCFGAGLDRYAVRLPDPRNFMAPPWPLNFWMQPVFTRDDSELQVRLAATEARNAAAVAAVDNLRSAVDNVAEAADARLIPLERYVRETAEALGDLERAAAAAEEADAAAEPAKSAGEPKRGGGVVGRPDGETEVPREVQVVKTDPALRYDTNFALDFLALAYAARGATGSYGVMAGTWYRTMQDALVADKPVAARKIDSQNGRLSRTFVAAVLASLQSAGRPYVGARAYSAFESAVLCLYAYSATTAGAAADRPAVAFAQAVEETPKYLDELADAISSAAGRPKYSFDAASASPKSVSTTTPAVAQSGGGGSRAGVDALSGHSVLAALTASRVLPPPPGAFPKSGVAPEVEAVEATYDDPVNRAAAALLGRAQTLFLMEDPILLRATLATITAMLLLRRLLWNSNVHGERTANSFQLGSLLLTGGSGPPVAEPGLPREAVKSDGRNFMWLMKMFVGPLYANDRYLELSNFFPGLVALSLEAASGGLSTPAARGTRRRVLDVTAGKGQPALVNLVALELENRGRNNVVSVRDVVNAHDTVAAQYERGLNVAMQLTRPREAFFDSGKAAAFNVTTDYDLCYFLCLGFVPKFSSLA